MRITKKDLEKRIASYCPEVIIEEADDQYEWYLNLKEMDDTKKLTLEQLNKIFSVEFLKDLHERICYHIGEWVYDQVVEIIEKENEKDES